MARDGEPVVVVRAVALRLARGDGCHACIASSARPSCASAAPVYSARCTWRNSASGCAAHEGQPSRLVEPEVDVAEVVAEQVCSIRVRSTRVAFLGRWLVHLAGDHQPARRSRAASGSALRVGLDRVLRLIALLRPLVYVRRLSRPSDLLIFSPSSRSRSFCNSLGTPLTLRSWWWPSAPAGGGRRRRRACRAVRPVVRDRYLNATSSLLRGASGAYCLAPKEKATW